MITNNFDVVFTLLLPYLNESFVILIIYGIQFIHFRMLVLYLKVPDDLSH